MFEVSKLRILDVTLPRLIQAHHQFPRLASRCELLASLMSTRPVAYLGTKVVVLPP